MWESGRTGEWERHGLDDDDDDDGGDDDGGVVGETCIVVLSTNDATIASSCKSVAVNIGGGEKCHFFYFCPAKLLGPGGPPKSTSWKRMIKLNQFQLSVMPTGRRSSSPLPPAPQPLKLNKLLLM